ncbi:MULTISPECIES: S8 family serine peptidase [unclassified Oceanobacter]|uniref:S8 family serine peptidase n=1 Tax=unclassified Oceanobacter TaxID=2620260 RepID=UPI002735D202|nr:MULTISPECIES: S8 family serine peptidase [unclassified Oceanobacter]MDP2610405.1 S8 family serine peptidase [Oceanobacter sp. 1_MG-2023]MDP2613641.1 S8 family serine peptidase [Oceanobacter sp. 2_MG-2023]
MQPRRLSLYLITLVAAIASLPGCGISEDSTTSTDTGTDTATYAVSGTVSAASNTAVDSDINDIYADYSSNNSLETAQAITNLVTVHGFVTRYGTRGAVSGESSLERFSNSGDQNDYYSVSLQAGQRIVVHVVDDNSNDSAYYNGDVDLQLIDENGDNVASSITTSTYETLTVPESGDYYIRVYAYSGTSKYVMSIATSSTSTGASTAIGNDFVSGQMLIQMQPDSQLSASNLISNKLPSSGLKTLSTSTEGKQRPALMNFDASDSSVMTLAANASQHPAESGNYQEKFATLMAVKQVAEQDDVLLAEPNYWRTAFATPTDPRYNEQWHYTAIDLPLAWELTTGERSDGIDVIVAVVDTGVYLSHSDLSDQLTSDGYDFISSTSNSNDGDGIDNDPDDPGDSTTTGFSSWHGTHVAGTLAAATNNDLGVAGIAWDAKVMPIRALGLEGGTSYDILQGMYYAAGLSNDSGTVPDQTADIINLSLGGSSYSVAEQSAITTIHDAGVIIVAASGNDGSSSVSYPAGYDNVIAVGATNADDDITYYSNYGSHLDLAAPGGNINQDLNNDGYQDGILSTLVNDSTGSRRSSYGYYNGTSMATPHVAGVIALMKAVYPDLNPDTLDTLISSGSISDDLGDSGHDNYFGYGRINALKAVNAAWELANNGVVSLPALLQTSPSVLVIGTDDSASFTLSNVGGGEPNITSVSATSSWLTVTPDSVDDQGFGSYLVSVTRTDLADGYYTDKITITSDTGSSTTLTANMTVGTVTGDGELTIQYVLFLDSSGEVIEEAITNSDGSFSANVSAGDYLLYAGSDVDVDYVICTDGETCGAYPTLNNPETVTVSDSPVSGLAMTVSIQAPTVTSTSTDSTSTDSTGTDSTSSASTLLQRSSSLARQRSLTLP